MFFIWANLKTPHPYNVHYDTCFVILSKLCMKFTITPGSRFSLGGWRGKTTGILTFQSITSRNVTSCYIMLHQNHTTSFWKHLYLLEGINIKFPSFLPGYLCKAFEKWSCEAGQWKIPAHNLFQIISLLKHYLKKKFNMSMNSTQYSICWSENIDCSPSRINLL